MEQQEKLIKAVNAELKEAAMPLVKYLRTHCTPMHVAIVDVAGVDLYAKDINVPIIV